MKKTITASVLLIIATAFTIRMIHWGIDPGTKSSFSIKGALGATVTGTLDISSSSIEFDPADPASASISSSVAVNTISTGNNLRDKHLKGTEYFNAEQYPEISFRSTSVVKTNDSSFTAKGMLTVKDSSKPVDIPFIFIQTGDTALFSGTFTIKRMDYAIGGKSMMIGNEVTVKLHIPVKKTAP